MRILRYRSVRVRWTPDARASLEEIRLGLAELSEAVAQRWTRRVVRRANKLTDLPSRGHRLQSSQGGDVRQVWEGSFRIVYRVNDGDIEVLLVRHGSRLLPPGKW